MATFPNKSYKRDKPFIIFILWSLIFVNVHGISNWTLVAENACYSTTNFSMNWTFNPPHSGNVTAVKLVYASGAVGCESGDQGQSNYARSWGIWGCVNGFSQVQLVLHNDDSRVHTVLPTNNTVGVTEIDTFWNHEHVDEDWYSISSWCENRNGCSIWQYKMDGVTVSDSDLVWAAPLLNLDVSTDDIFSLQYGEGCCNFTTNDNLQAACVDVYFQFASIISPSTDPSDEPTSVSSLNPTKTPSSDLTESPTNYPSSNPTNAPSTLFCQSIRLDIIDFDGFDSDDLSNNETLQEEVANVTHHALAQTVLTANYEIDTYSFYVIYHDSLDANVYDNGNVQQSVHIDEILCASLAADSDLLTEMIQNDAKMINSILAKRLTALYLEGQWSDTMKVSIAGATELSSFVKVVLKAPC